MSFVYPISPPAQDILGWLARQLPDATIIWTAPSGPTYTTHPGSRLLFPTLCRPTAPVNTTDNVASVQPHRGVMMPRRNTTRAQDRAKRIEGRTRAEPESPQESRKCVRRSRFPITTAPLGEIDDPPPF
jgi:hypothetical protein